MKLLSLILIAFLINYACITRKAEAIEKYPKVSAANVINSIILTDLKSISKQTQLDCEVLVTDSSNDKTKQIKCNNVVSRL